MSAIERRSDPTSLYLRRMAEHECRRFRRRNLRYAGPGRRVHAVELRDWLGGLQLPAPACHQAGGGFVFDGHAEPATQPVNCIRCRTLPDSIQARLTVVDGGQLVLELAAEDTDQSGDNVVHRHRPVNNV